MVELQEEGRLHTCKQTCVLTQLDEPAPEQAVVMLKAGAAKHMVEKQLNKKKVETLDAVTVHKSTVVELEVNLLNLFRQVLWTVT